MKLSEGAVPRAGDECEYSSGIAVDRSAIVTIKEYIMKYIHLFGPVCGCSWSYSSYHVVEVPLPSPPADISDHSTRSSHSAFALTSVTSASRSVLPRLSFRQARPGSEVASLSGFAYAKVFLPSLPKRTPCPPSTPPAPSYNRRLTLHLSNSSPPLTTLFFE